MKIVITTNKKTYVPVVLSGVTWSTERKSSPGILKFKILPDADLDIMEGNIVTASHNKVKFFKGYIFQIKISKSDPSVEITAYDQLRYFKNKDSKIYKKLTSDALLRSIADTYKLQVGDCDNTGYAISRVEEASELFTMMENSMLETLQQTGKGYVLFDDYGKLRLKNIESLRLPLVIDDKSAQGCTVVASIDDDYYNQVKLAYENDGTLEYYIVKDTESINKYGLLQKYEKVNSSDGAERLANVMLKNYNCPVRNITYSGVFGDIRVRAGYSIARRDPSGAMPYMLIESAKHKFDGGVHTMDLTLKGEGYY